VLFWGLVFGGLKFGGFIGQGSAAPSGPNRQLDSPHHG
jgi:hypothetical protein